MLLIIGIGGMIGSTLRYFISLILISNSPVFPLSTLTVNLLGCFLLSYLLNIEKRRKLLSPHLMTGLTTGVLGSFTTYSTFVVETITLNSSTFSITILYIVSSLGGGLLCCYAGFKLANRKKVAK
ncbi:camphor resistance protein CrcB [Virgibacillus sp. SK37]|nr:camphor resistance protein CrcB [Virgibacillus sp. SK37]